MTAVILSEDFLAICLILAEGDTKITLDEVIGRAEVYQESSDRHFGISRGDFRCALAKLSFQIYHETGVGNFEEMLTRNPFLEHWIRPILNYEDVYFNDEGEHWCEYERLSPTHGNLKMRRFFADNCDQKPEEIMGFLNEIGKNRTTLLKCSFPGKQH